MQFGNISVMNNLMNTKGVAIQRGAQQGFTLIEVMVVVVILGILAALIVPNVMGRGEKAKVDTSKITLANVASALDQYKLDNNKYPNTQEGLDALVNQPSSAKNWMAGGYLKAAIQKTVGITTCNMLHQVLTVALMIYIHLALMVKRAAKAMMRIFTLKNK